jgi:hypothetical protein
VAIIIQQQLFSWDEIDASSDLDRLKLALNYLPDEKLVQRLEKKRGRGRDTYPIRAMWNAVIAGVVLQHPSVESLLRELRRNAELRALCGFNTFRGSRAVPTPWAMSRFMKSVVEEEKLIREIFEELVDQAKKLLPDLGSELAFDGKAIRSFSTGHKDRDTGKTSDPDADWGRKSYSGIDSQGKPWEKIMKWFGYQLHLIVDANHELPLAFEVERASTSEATRLLPMVKDLTLRHPEIGESAETLVADRGLDSAEINRDLLDDYNIKPVIDTRALWREEKGEQGRNPEKTTSRPLVPSRVDTLVYTERGSVKCICPVSGVETDMAFWGFESDRQTLKYRCPAAAYGVYCPGRTQCELLAPKTPGPYGRIVRVPLKNNRRIFTPIPRDTPKWQRLYAKRTSVERVNSRIETSFGFDRHNIRGMKKMRMRVGLALAIMMAMAVGFISEGKPEFMRSLVMNPRGKPRAA